MNLIESNGLKKNIQICNFSLMFQKQKNRKSKKIKQIHTDSEKSTYSFDTKIE